MIKQGILWFGAAVSITEIITGSLIMPLGLERGITAIVVGHIIGGIIFYLAGLIGAKTEKSAMESAKNSFGKKGAMFFSALNILQLVGWTAVMISSGSSAANNIFKIGDGKLWNFIIGGLIILWVLKENSKEKSYNKLNLVAMITLFFLTIYMSKNLFSSNSAKISEGVMSFGSAVELSVAMPLSWLPLVSDYTCNSKNPKKAAMISSIIYFITSTWMYIIGLGVGLYIGNGDFNLFMEKAGFGLGGLLIIVLSTVTTTFLDVYSAGVSGMIFFPKESVRKIGVITCIIAMVFLNIMGPDKYESFLYLISSVFSPMIAIQIVDNFILKKDYSNQLINYRNMIIWSIGFIMYQVSMRYSSPLGNSVPVIIVVMILTFMVDRIVGGEKLGEERVN